MLRKVFEITTTGPAAYLPPGVTIIPVLEPAPTSRCHGSLRQVRNPFT